MQTLGYGYWPTIVRNPGIVKLAICYNKQQNQARLVFLVTEQPVPHRRKFVLPLKNSISVTTNQAKTWNSIYLSFYQARSTSGQHIAHGTTCGTSLQQFIFSIPDPGGTMFS